VMISQVHNPRRRIRLIFHALLVIPCARRIWQCLVHFTNGAHRRASARRARATSEDKGGFLMVSLMISTRPNKRLLKRDILSQTSIRIVLKNNLLNLVSSASFGRSSAA
jgi:hypothetical protein